MASVLDQFGKQLRSLRESQGISQEDLAFKAGLHRNFIGGLERGEQNPSLITIEKIAKALRVKMIDLIPKGR